ncbi:MAG: lysine--tRNA ligase [Holosporales bacterium]|jgi:lysyl-tRNA synthetase class 1|nr:lysine--tRNA ligase [Holosporales bacterium]
MPQEEQERKEPQSWPFQEARKLLARVPQAQASKGYILFETGYGPSGLPHLGTFGEVARTTFVRRAFETLSSCPTRLFAFSDDRDGLRKVPQNTPQQQRISAFLEFPLTQTPDPWECCDSFGHHNNNKLRSFLDSFGFQYEFKSATDCYLSGIYDAALLKVLFHHEEILEIMLPSLRAERAATYSPFFPISPKTGKILQVAIEHYDIPSGTIVFTDEDGTRVEVPVNGRTCKLQWKVDWATRWYVFGVDYEMSGKDLIPSFQLSSRICRALGGVPPEGFHYELFLDEESKKISKSKGNGLTMEEWIRYGPVESLSTYLFHSPKSAKRLFFDVIPRQVEEYLACLDRYAQEDEIRRQDNPVWHIHAGAPPSLKCDLSFGVLLNLASVCNTEDPTVLWGFIVRYRPEASPERMPFLAKLVGHAIAYYKDFVKPHKLYRTATETEKQALADLGKALSTLTASEAETIQAVVYEVGKAHGFSPLRTWFSTLYETLLGQKEGPRMGSFIALYGIAETMQLIETALKREKEETMTWHK